MGYFCGVMSIMFFLSISVYFMEIKFEENEDLSWDEERKRL
jgi:hypothetical protein